VTRGAQRRSVTAVVLDLSEEQRRRVDGMNAEIAELRRQHAANEKRRSRVTSLPVTRSQRREVVRIVGRLQEIETKIERLKAELALLQQQHDETKDERAKALADRSQEITIACPADGEQMKMLMGQVIDGETVECPKCKATIKLTATIDWSDKEDG